GDNGRTHLGRIRTALLTSTASSPAGCRAGSLAGDACDAEGSEANDPGYSTGRPRRRSRRVAVLVLCVVGPAGAGALHGHGPRRQSTVVFRFSPDGAAVEELYPPG